MLALLIIILILAAFFTMPRWMLRKWYRALLYTGGRPNALSRRLNAAQAWVTSRGMTPSLMVALETKGRVTGKTISVPMVVAEVNFNDFRNCCAACSAQHPHIFPTEPVGEDSLLQRTLDPSAAREPLPL